MNIQKGEQNGFNTDLQAVDKVRIDDTAMFKKGSENRWSDKICTVASAMGKTVALTDGTMHKRDKVLLVPHHTVKATTEKNVIKVATKQHKDKQLFKRENIKANDVIEGGRSARSTRTQNDYMALNNGKKLEKVTTDSDKQASKKEHKKIWVPQPIY